MLSSRAQVNAFQFGQPSWTDAYAFSSWGQTIVNTNDVVVFPLETAASTTGWTSFSATVQGVQGEAAFQTRLGQGDIQRVMIIQPGTNFGGTAYMGPGTLPNFPSYQREQGGAIFWGTMVHELGHNLGLSHAGGRTRSGSYQQYQDDALMGYQRNHRIADMNVISRYQLGWIPIREVASYPSVLYTTLRALNEGISATDGAVLSYIVPCSFCESRAQPGATGGHLYISLRVADATARYGVSNSVSLYPIASNGEADASPLVLEDRVHVHFQRTGGRKTEIWMTLNTGESQAVPGSSGANSLYIKACTFTLGGAVETAVVAVGSSPNPSCTGQPFPPPSAPSPPASPPPPSSPPAPPPVPTEPTWCAQYAQYCIRSSQDNPMHSDLMSECIITCRSPPPPPPAAIFPARSPWDAAYVMARRGLVVPSWVPACGGGALALLAALVVVCVRRRRAMQANARPPCTLRLPQAPMPAALGRWSRRRRSQRLTGDDAGDVQGPSAEGADDARPFDGDVKV